MARPALRGWDILIEERFALASRGIQDGDLSLLAAMLVHDRLDEFDVAVALRTESLVAALTTENVTYQIREVAENVRHYNVSIKRACEEISRSICELLRLVHCPGRDEWQEHIDQEINGLKTTTAEGLQRLRGWGVRKIGELPVRLRPLTARLLARGWQSVLGVFAKALAWLRMAKHPTKKWLRNASDYTGRWREELIGWFLVAGQEIDEWFVAAAVTLQQRRFLSRIRNFYRDGGGERPDT